VAADGAEWPWTVAADLFPDSTQIVDWYHATQHLAQAAHALFPTDFQPMKPARWSGIATGKRLCFAAKPGKLRVPFSRPG
jgi:hypothetical protein